MDMMLYGFAAQAAFAITLWLFCRLGRTQLRAAGIPFLAAIIWNIGVIAGTVAILLGNSTGIEWLEFPSYAIGLLFIAYALIGLWAVSAFHARRQQQLFPSQWYLLAGLFWFAWIYSAANILLVFAPVRGVVQICVNAWYASNILNVWLSAIGVGAVFYFIPKITNRPLYSYYSALFAFWTIALFGGWGFMNTNSPLPSWIPSISVVIGSMIVLPILAVAYNVRRTLCGYKSAASNPILTFMRFAVLSFIIAQLMNLIGSIRVFNEFLAFSYFPVAQVHWQLVGFFASVAFGAIYYIVPLVLNLEPVAAGKIRAQLLLLVSGVLFYGIALAIGGIAQGIQMNNPHVAFADVIKTTLPFLHISTIGSLLLVLAGILLVFNLASFTARACCACCKKSGKSEVRS
jgi:cytochrome c oxidase cbb3-type subunit 1